MVELEIVSWSRKGRGWTSTHLTANGTDTLCGRELRLEFGRRFVDAFSNQPETDIVGCEVCCRMYETQQEFHLKEGGR